MLGTPLRIRKIIDESIGRLDDRSAKVLTNRYGLYGEKVKTLASLGHSYGLTRERVRQIEESCLENIRKSIDQKESQIVLKLINDYLNRIGNLRRGDLLVRDLRTLFGVKYEEGVLSNELHLLVKVIGEPEIIPHNNDWHDIWHNDKRAYQLASDVIHSLLKFKQHDFARFLETATNKFNLPEVLIVNYLSASKRFGVGPRGDLGAKHWINVNPKTVRDKSFLVMKYANAPLHFKEIASLVNNLTKKQSHPATVHNELIKDPRFVLVSRGTYALKEHLRK